MKRYIIVPFFILSGFVCAVEELPVIDIEKTKNLIQEGAVLIDNRPPYKYENGHIEGAVNLPFFYEGHSSNLMTRQELLKIIGEKRIVIFYCTGKMRAYHALNQAKKWDIPVVMYWYKNGFSEWKNQEPFIK
ncbi:MAG: rhodanese-like domain-containing protein [Fibrobacterota bacterium]